MGHAAPGPHSHFPYSSHILSPEPAGSPPRRPHAPHSFSDDLLAADAVVSENVSPVLEAGVATHSHSSSPQKLAAGSPCARATVCSPFLGSYLLLCSTTCYLWYPLVWFPSFHLAIVLNPQVKSKNSTSAQLSAPSPSYQRSPSRCLHAIAPKLFRVKCRHRPIALGTAGP